MIPPPDNFLLPPEDIFQNDCYFFQFFYWFSIVNCAGQIQGLHSVFFLMRSVFIERHLRNKSLLKLTFFLKNLISLAVF